MPSFSPDVKKFPGAASCMLRLLIACLLLAYCNFSGGALSQEWHTRKTDQPQTLLVKSAY